MGNGSGTKTILIGENSSGNTLFHTKEQTSHDTTGDCGRMERTFNNGSKYTRNYIKVEKNYTNSQYDIKQCHEWNQFFGHLTDSFDAEMCIRDRKYTVTGFLLMLLVCRIDYSILGKWSRQIAGGILLFILLSLVMGVQVYGRIYEMCIRDRKGTVLKEGASYRMKATLDQREYELLLKNGWKQDRDGYIWYYEPASRKKYGTVDCPFTPTLLKNAQGKIVDCYLTIPAKLPTGSYELTELTLSLIHICLVL